MLALLVPGVKMGGSPSDAPVILGNDKVIRMRRRR
jgi:hypothetical protein